MELLSRFGDALWSSGGDAWLHRAANRLLELSQRIHPGRRPRSDRPVRPGAASPGKSRPEARRPGKPPRSTKEAKTASQRRSRRKA
jgi:hypothetical protein